MKHKIDNENDDDSTKTKKERKFHAKTFRKSLSKETALESVQEFVQLCLAADQTQDYAKEYLESGGNCSELLRVIENKTNLATATTIFQSFSIVLLKVLSNYPEKQATAEETCRELLNKHFVLVKNMLSLKSNTKQKIIALKLLSTMVTVSSQIAREVLVHTDFDQVLLRILTKPTSVGDDKKCRTSFIHFLISFLIEGNTATKIGFLKKLGFLGSIFPGMVFDTFDTINLVLSTLKDKVLEDTSISKTLKINTFNSQVIQNLFNLYRWKGPDFVKTKNIKRTPVLDPVQNQLVGDCVHRFLLTLCTSYKFGVVFREPTVGLSGKNYNYLIYTVLKKLKTPWEHKLMSELVINICVSCPDLVKFVLTDLEPYLEPRLSSKWTSAIRFVKKLLENLTPSCVTQYFPELNARQIATIIELFSAPKVLLKVISSDTILHEHIGVRHQGILMLNMIFESVLKYLDELKNIQSEQDCENIKNLVVNYLNKYLPAASVILSDWKLSLKQVNVVPNPTISAPNIQDHLEKVLNVLYYYNLLCPQLVDNITNELHPNEFLETVESLSKDNMQQGAEFLKRAINVLLMCDTSLFLPSSNLFSYVVPKLLNSYYISAGELQLEIEKSLTSILITSGIFEGCVDEIMVWLYSVLEQETYSEEIGIFFVYVVQNTYNNFLKYITNLSKLKEEIADESSYNIKKLIHNLYKENNEVRSKDEYSKHTILSPLILGIINSSTELNFDKVSNYLNMALVHLLHFQTSAKLLKAIVLKDNNCTIFSKHIVKYYKIFENSDKVKKMKLYNSSSVIGNMIDFLMDDDGNSDIQASLTTNANLNLSCHHILILNRLLLFYFTQWCENKILTQSKQLKLSNSVIYFLKKLDDEKLNKCLIDILKHPTVFDLFHGVLHSEHKMENLCTNFVIHIISELVDVKTRAQLENVLSGYRNTLVRQLISLFKKCEQHECIPNDVVFMNVLNILDLNHEQSAEVLNSLVKLPTKCLLPVEKNASLLELLCYILNKNVGDKEFNPFGSNEVTSISVHLKHLYSLGSELNLENLENSLISYLEKYPHSKKTFSGEVFKSLLHKPVVNKPTARLGMLLLEKNKANVEELVAGLDEIIEKRELIFTLLQTTLTEDSAKLTSTLEKVYKEHENILIKYLNKPQKISNYLIENYKVVQKLLENYFTKEKYTGFVSTSHKFDVSELQHAEILTTVFRKSVIEPDVSQEEKFKYISNYNTTMMNLLINALRKEETSDDDWKKIEKIADLFNVWLKDSRRTWNYTNPKLCKNSTFQTFSKFCLKLGLQGNPTLIKILNQLCLLVNDNDSYLDDLFQMTVSHSEALNILLSENNLKANIVEFLLTICKKCPSVMVRAHIPVWLGSYGATLSDSDQCLLQLMQLYEEHKVGFEDYRPYLWGNAAVEHYSVRYGVESALWTQPKPREILNLFEDNIINNTIVHFPRYRSFQTETKLYSKGERSVYDPAFYLPLLSYLLVPESPIKWFQCTRRGVIGLAFIALSSEVPRIRAAACLVLSRFHAHLEASKQGKDRLLWLHLVETICRSASKLDNTKISSIVAVFLGRSAKIFTEPGHPLYIPLGNYFKAKETHEFRIVPQFLTLLHSTETNKKIHRNFILEVIRDGLQNDYDLQVLFRSVAFKFLLDLYNSVLVDEEDRILILQILANAIRISLGNNVLTSNFSILPWFNAVVHQTDTNSRKLSIYLDIFSNLARCSKIKNLSYMKINVIYFLTQFIDILKSMKLTEEDLAKYLKALCDAYWVNEIISRKNLHDLISVCLNVFDCRICEYFLKFGCEFVCSPVCQISENDAQGCYYLKMLTIKWIQANELEICL